MIFFVIKIIFTIFAMFTALTWIKELYSYLVWYKFYRPQGIQYYFTPVLGFIYWFLVDLHPMFENMTALRKHMNPFFNKNDGFVKFRQV